MSADAEPTWTRPPGYPANIRSGKAQGLAPDLISVTANPPPAPPRGRHRATSPRLPPEVTSAAWPSVMTHDLLPPQRHIVAVRSHAQQPCARLIRRSVRRR